MMTKQERQELGLDRWKQLGSKGIGVYPTGFGKTYIGSLLNEKAKFRNPHIKVQVIANNQIVKKHWVDTLKDDSVNVVTLDEAINGKLHTADIMIIDEIHKYTSNIRYAFLKAIYNHSKFVLGLTATIPSNRLHDITMVFPIVDEVTEYEALKNKWISQFVEYNIKVDFTEERRDLYEELTAVVKDTLVLFKNVHRHFPLKEKNAYMFRNDYDVLQSCLSGKVHNGVHVAGYIIRNMLAASKGWHSALPLDSQYNEMLNTNWSPDAIHHNAQLFNNVVRKRLDLINVDVNKLEAVIELFNNNPVTTICFNESTTFADNIANVANGIVRQELGNNYSVAVSYHSNIESRPLIDPTTGEYYRYKSGAKKDEVKMFGKKKLRDDAIEGTTNGRYTLLCTAKALEEGVDIPNIEQVITTSGTASPLTHKQRSGRGKRLDIYNPSKITKIFNLYFDDFDGRDGNRVYNVDKRKLIDRQADSTNSIYWYDSVKHYLSSIE